ncbi:MAG: RNA methyltransferase [Clostridia bacterium]|nr:RNA methyltransferase [Clostridia bacterium]
MNDFEYITSRQNEKIKSFSKLKDKKFRDASREFLCEGVKLSLEAVMTGNAKCILIREDLADSEDVKNIIDKCSGDVIKYILAGTVFEKITTENSPQGVITVAKYPDNVVSSSDVAESFLNGKRAVALDGIRDPGNLGTIIRSAVAFGFDAVILGDSADVLSPKTARASMGAVFNTDIIVTDDLASFLSEMRRSGRNVIGACLADSSEDFLSMKKAFSDVVVIGNEGHGISDSVLGVCSSYTKIPISDRAESLNAGVAAAIILWEYSKIQRA